MGFRSAIIIWDFDTSHVVAKYDSHKVRVESMAFSCCENYLLSVGGVDDGAVLVYDIVQQQMLCASSSTTPNAGVATALRPARARGQCFVVTGDNTLRLWTLDRDRRTVHGLDASFAKIKRKILCIEIDRLDEYAYCGTSTGDVLKVKLNLPSTDAAAVRSAALMPVLVDCFAKTATTMAGRKRGDVELYCNGITSLYLTDGDDGGDDGHDDRHDDDDDGVDDNNDCYRDGAMIVGTGNGVVELVRQQAGRRCTAGRLAVPTHPLLAAVKSVNVQATVTSIQMTKKKKVSTHAYGDGTEVGIDGERTRFRGTTEVVTCVFPHGTPTEVRVGRHDGLRGVHDRGGHVRGAPAVHVPHRVRQRPGVPAPLLRGVRDGQPERRARMVGADATGTAPDHRAEHGVHGRAVLVRRFADRDRVERRPDPGVRAPVGLRAVRDQQLSQKRRDRDRRYALGRPAPVAQWRRRRAGARLAAVRR